MLARGRKGMVANAMGHSFDRAGGVSSRERGAGLVRLRTVRLDADSVGIAFRREQGVVVAHAMGHRFDRADGVFGPGRGADPVVQLADAASARHRRRGRS
jgi:hypothetical protein